MQDFKNYWRREMRRRLAELPDARRAAMSHLLVEHLTKWPAWATARSVGLFASRPDEPDLSTLWSGAGLAGKRVLYPRVTGLEMSFFPVTSPTELQEGCFGLLEPTVGNPEIPELVLVPGLAFDGHGGRLGRGKGYYDRWLTEHSVLAVGLCFSLQLLDGVPTGPLDAPMTALFTEQGCAYQTAEFG